MPVSSVCTTDNLLAAGCQLSLVFSFIGAMLIRLHEEFSLIYGDAIVGRVMVFKSTTVIAAPIVALNYDLFGIWSFKPHHWGSEDFLLYWSAIGACVAAYFLFPKKQEA